MAEDTRFRVQEAIDTLGFVPNETARQLRQGRGRALGVVVEDLANPFFADLAQGAEAAMDADGSHALWCSSDGLPAKERRCLEFLEQQQVGGVLITPVGLDSVGVAELHERGVAVVILDRSTGDDVCSVRVDHVAGGEAAAGHLVRRHRRLAYVTGPGGIGHDRHAGALRALRKAGLDDDAMVTLAQKANTPTAGQAAARRLADLDPAPTGVLCAGDLLAIGLVNELLRIGVKVPQEVAVVGYDDIELAATAAVPLTTVRQPRHELGWTAAELAVAEAADPERHRHQQIVFRPDLVLRESG